MTLRLLLAAGLVWGAAARGADLRIGIIGCDTSHVVAFTETLNNPEAKGHVPGGKVVAAYKGGSPDIPSSIDRIEGYSKTLREKYGVKFYDRIEEMCQDVDVVLLESVDGRPHLEQVKPVLHARKPVFIDKPMAASLQDVIEIFRLAKEAKVPVFSSSSLRFARDTQAVRGGLIGRVTYAETYGPCEREPHHPDLFWYGVHGWRACSRSWERAAKRCSARPRLMERSKWWAPGAAGGGASFGKTRTSTAWPRARRGRRRRGRLMAMSRWWPPS